MEPNLIPKQFFGISSSSVRIRSAHERSDEQAQTQHAFYNFIRLMHGGVHIEEWIRWGTVKRFFIKCWNRCCPCCCTWSLLHSKKDQFKRKPVKRVGNSNGKNCKKQKKNIKCDSIFLAAKKIENCFICA